MTIGQIGRRRGVDPFSGKYTAIGDFDSLSDSKYTTKYDYKSDYKGDSARYVAGGRGRTERFRDGGGRKKRSQMDTAVLALAFAVLVVMYSRT